jgi:hypothetical protein
VWRAVLVPALIAGLVAPARVRAQEGGLSVIVKGNLTTSSLVFVSPDAADPTMRGNTFDLTGTFGYGVEVRYRIPETSLAIGLSTDVIRSRGASTLEGTGIPVTDGYDAIPIELTGYFIIPFSGQYFGVYMGGGAGVYFGSRSYTLGGVEAASIQSTPGFAIHVLGGISYRFLDSFQGIFEMKFRDLQFQSVNAFTTPAIRYGGHRSV